VAEAAGGGVEDEDEDEEDDDDDDEDEDAPVVGLFAGREEGVGEGWVALRLVVSGPPATLTYVSLPPCTAGRGAGIGASSSLSLCSIFAIRALASSNSAWSRTTLCSSANLSLGPCRPPLLPRPPLPRALWAPPPPLAPLLSSLHISSSSLGCERALLGGDFLGADLLEGERERRLSGDRRPWCSLSRERRSLLEDDDDDEEEEEACRDSSSLF